MPIRIVLGYDGFKSLKNFRQAFIDYLQENISSDLENKKRGFGPISFPSQMICGKFSILKNNGMPFGFPISSDRWNVLMTYSGKPVYFLLEYIWTKLSYRFKLSSFIFGEDMYMEEVNRFVDGSIVNVNGHYGWQFSYFDLPKDYTKHQEKGVGWSPVILNDNQFLVINYLCLYSEINIVTSKPFNEILKKEGKTALEFYEELNKTGLTFIESNMLKLLTKKCQCVMMPDGRLVAGENASGRLSRWVANEIKKDP